ncbi:MAG TPA: DUF1707 domain-containing protein [Solirubrobacteraceae bacterium]
MTWLDALATELSARGVPARQRARILLELRDHIASEPGCEDRLGDPRMLAVSFADELATARARRCAFGSFGALALTALALIVSQLAIGHAGGYPGFTNGISLVLFVPALLGMFVAPQIALVAGTLAALRAARRRRRPHLPAAEIGLIGRRARVALLAGFGTVTGLALYLADFSQRLPAWYLGLVGGLGAVAAAALYLAFSALRHAQAIVSGSDGAAGDVYDDLPLIAWPWLRSRPWRLGAVGTLIIALIMTLFFAHAEHSLAEGLQRGIAEGLAVAAGFVLLGRAVGLFPAHSEAVTPPGQLAIAAGLIADPEDQLAGDDDRSRAELILRESFGQGRLSLDELTARVSAVHDAETVGQLRDALAGLPPQR